MSTNASVLPDANVQNFAAARACLQSYLAPIGAIVQKLGIQQNQNGVSLWRVLLSSTLNFPSPTSANFTAVRAVLNNAVPQRGVLRTIELYVPNSQQPTWYWEVCYGTKTKTRGQKALKALKSVIRKVTPCLQGTAVQTLARTQHTALLRVVREKENSRKYYQIRQEKLRQKANSKLADDKPKPPTVEKKSQQKTNSAPKKKRNTTSQPDGKYNNFIRGPALKPARAEKPKVINIQPDYDQWEVRSILGRFKDVTVNDARALATIASCKSNGKSLEVTAASIYLKNRCPAIQARHIPDLLNQVVESLGVPLELIRAFKVKNDMVDKFIVHEHSVFSSTKAHFLCTH